MTLPEQDMQDMERCNRCGYHVDLHGRCGICEVRDIDPGDLDKLNRAAVFGQFLGQVARNKK